jgi:hypothetical protein
MPTLPEIRIPMPEEEQPLTLYGRITNTNEPPKYDDIQNSNLPKEEKIRQIQYRTKAYQDDLDRQLHKDYARMGAGTTLSTASFLPIFNIPYVGTGIGGAMYDLGQGIVEGDTAGDLAKRAGRGFVIGETIGAIPYVGKALGKTKAGQAVINSAPVQAVGNVLNKAGEKFANSKLYDALMTDVRAFNPNKQTAYHGSPYDFEKFSNEAIGTGEGAQAHGYGHYAALNKDIADKRYRQKLLDNTQSNYIIDDVLLDGNYPLVNHNFNPESVIKDAEYYGGTNKLLEKYKKDYAEAIEEQARIKSKYSENADPYRDFDDIDQMLYSNANILEKNLKSKIPFLDSIKDKKITQNEGQLYKLSIPKDDVMLREDLPFSEQPKAVQDFINDYRINKVKDISKDYNDFKDFINYNDINLEKTFGTKYTNDAYEIFKNNPEKYFKLYDVGFIGKDFYNQLVRDNYTAKNVNNLLNKHGIKGISYNGGIDGEARVIFNPDDIEIIRKYYNQPGLFEQLTGASNSGAAVDSLYNKIAR